MISTPDQTSGAGRLWDRFTSPTERYRRPFRRWRRGRPFYAGLSVAIAGLDIWYWPHSGVGKMLSMGLPGISSLFIAIFLLVFAITVWFFPTYRVFSGIASIMLALLSLVATNLGGFFLGFLFGMFGGAFAIAWTPRADYTAETRRQRRRNAGTGIAGNEAVEPGIAENGAAGPGFAESGVAEPVVAQSALATAEAEAEAASSREAFAAYADNAQIIEQTTRSDQAAPAGFEPGTEEE